MNSLLPDKRDCTGLLFLIAGIIIFMGIITAEIYYLSTYSTREDEISDLAATKPPNSIIFQPSATILNSSLILSGILIIIASFCFLFRNNNSSFYSLAFIGLGIGFLGVGVFPGNITPYHSIFAFILFISGGISVLLSTHLSNYPINVVFVGLGIISMFFLIFNQLMICFLGKGGAERWILYPIIIWMIGFGSYYIGEKKQIN